MKSENMVTYGVHRFDPATGKTTRIDLFDAHEDYTVQDYLAAIPDDCSPERLEYLRSGTLSLVRLPACESYTLPLEIPDDGPQDIV